jgi:hypothetical protein
VKIEEREGREDEWLRAGWESGAQGNFYSIFCKSSRWGSTFDYAAERISDLLEVMP